MAATEDTISTTKQIVALQAAPTAITLMYSLDFVNTAQLDA